MKTETLRQKLYEKYIQPTTKKRKEFIGVEIEMPIVNLAKKAVDFNIVHQVTKSFLQKFGFEVCGVDDEGNIYSLSSKANGDILSYDCSYNNLELSFGKETELYTIQSRFEEYYGFLNGEFSKYGYTLTGMGVNPYRIYNHNIPIPNGRYRMLFHHLHSYRRYDMLPMYFHKYPEFGTFSSASQVQLDVSYDKLPLTLNTFSKLEPLKAVLFSNSVLLSENENLLCCRDMFWENSTHGINPHNIGMYGVEFETADDILSYIETTSIYCAERGDKYINFPPVSLEEYFRCERVTGEYFDGKKYCEITFEPSENDLKYLRTFKFEDLTFRGTVEYRSVCCQPISDFITVSAFHLGLADKVEELAELLNNDTVIYGHGYNASELRKMFVQRELPAFIDTDELYNLIRQVLDISFEGLKERGFNEEYLLSPLYERAESRTNPAKTMLERIEHGDDIQDIILDYSKLHSSVSSKIR